MFSVMFPSLWLLWKQKKPSPFSFPGYGYLRVETFSVKTGFQLLLALILLSSRVPLSFRSADVSSAFIQSPCRRLWRWFTLWSWVSYSIFSSWSFTPHSCLLSAFHLVPGLKTECDWADAHVKLLTWMTVATCWEKMSKSLISAGIPGPSSRWANRASLKNKSAVYPLNLTQKGSSRVWPHFTELCLWQKTESSTTLTHLVPSFYTSLTADVFLMRSTSTHTLKRNVLFTN